MTASDLRDFVVPVLGLATLSWAVYTTRRGWAKDHAIRRADFVRNYTDDFYRSPILAELFADMDYGRFKLGLKDLGTQHEIDVSRLLDFYNTVGLAVDQDIVDVDDLRLTTIGYAIGVAWRDPHIQWFLAHVDAHDREREREPSVEAFGYFRHLGEFL